MAKQASRELSSHPVVVVVSLLLGIGGILFAVLTHWADREVCDLRVWQVGSDELLVSPDHPTDMAVQFRELSLSEGVGIFRAQIWIQNCGTKVISNDMILKPIALRLGGSTSGLMLLDLMVRGESRDVVDFTSSVRPSTNETDRLIDIGFAVLEPDDAEVIEVIYAASHPERFTVEGTLLGQPVIQATSSEVEPRSRRERAKQTIMLVILGSTFGLIGLYGMLITVKAWYSGLRQPDGPQRLKEGLLESGGQLLGIGGLVGFVVLVVWLSGLIAAVFF